MAKIFSTTVALLIAATTAHADCQWISKSGSSGTAPDFDNAIAVAPAGQLTNIKCTGKNYIAFYQLNKDKSGDRSTIIGRHKKEKANG